MQSLQIEYIPTTPTALAVGVIFINQQYHLVFLIKLLRYDLLLNRKFPPLNLKNPKNLPIFVFKVKTYENEEVPSFTNAPVGITQYKGAAEDLL